MHPAPAKISFLRAILLFMGGVWVTAVPCANAQIILGVAESFSVLAASTVTNTGPTTVFGDLGLSPGSSVVGFPPGVVTGGTIHISDALSIQAQIDATAAYVQLAGLPATSTLTGMDLGGMILTPGVYFFASSAQLTGTLTLDGQNLVNPLFVFQIGSALTVASSSSFNLINGASACDAFFQVGSSTTIGTNAFFAGTIISQISDTLTTGAILQGRAFALTGAVTLDSNQISNYCAADITDPGTGPSVTAVPEATTGVYAGAGLALLALFGKRLRVFRPRQH